MSEWDETDGSEWAKYLRPLNWPISGVARNHLEWHLDRWTPGSTIGVRMMLHEINRGLSEPFPARELDDVVENYELMGWVTVDRSNPADPMITSVAPLYFEQSTLFRTERLQARHDSYVRRARLNQDREALSPTVAQIGLDPEAAPQELAHLLLTRHQFIVERTMPDMVSLGYLALVRHAQDDRRHLAKGRGNTEGEAICFAAARAYLDRQARERNRLQ